MRRNSWCDFMLAAAVYGCLPGLVSPVSGRSGADLAPHSDLQALVAAERAFAADAAARSMRDAFLTWLDGDALVMRPRATPARAFYAGRPPSSVMLAWEPVFAAVSRSGELGYTTGPWTYRATPGDSVAAWGDYVSIWRRRDDGTWRVAIDLGVSHPRPSEAAPRLGFPGDGRFAGSSAAAETVDADRREAAEAAEAELRAFEAGFAARARHDGPAAAFQEFAGEEIRLCREGAEPWLGRERALLAARAEEGPAGASRVLGLGVARAGDLGYAWGETVSGTDATLPPVASWVRIWARGGEGAWRIVLDITLPVPPEAAGG